MPKDAPSKGRTEPPSDVAAGFPHNRALPERLRQYDQSRQLISQSFDPLTTPQEGDRTIADPPIASLSGPSSSHDSRSKDFDSFMSNINEPKAESGFEYDNLRVEKNSHDSSQNDPLSLIPEFLEQQDRVSSHDRRTLVDGSIFDHRPPPTPRRSRSRPAAEPSDVSDCSEHTESDYSVSEAPSLGSDPYGEGTGFLPCEFVGYSNCDYQYDLADTEQWMKHIMDDHLSWRLPEICACWYCDEFVFDTRQNGLDPITNFRQRLYHIREHITGSDYGITNIRPDFDFLKHLWSLGMISQKAYNEAVSYREGPQSNFNMLDEDGTHHGDNILTYQTGGLPEDSQSRLEDPRNPRLSFSGTNELPDSHEQQSTSDRNVLNPETEEENDVPALDPAAAGISSRQDIQAPTDSGYASGLHPKAMQVEAPDEQTWNNGLYSAQTIYTYSNISSYEDRGYISEFAADLAQVSELLSLSLGTAEHILEVLPQLLKAFALRLGYNANDAVYRNISVFVHKQRFHIQKSLRSKLPFEETEGDADNSETIRDTSLNGEFAINRFLQEPVVQDYLPMVSSSNVEDEQDIEIDDHQFRGIIQSTEAYQWLIAALKREANLMRSTPDTMQDVEESILSFLPESHRFSRREPPQAFTIELQLDWNPLLFARQQEYSDPPDLSLQRAITLTGSSKNAQAMTTRQYLVQTWPNTGNFVMDLVANAVRAPGNAHSSCVLPDGTDTTVKLAGDKFIVTVKWIADTLAEVGQQFAWLGAALRSSPYDSGIATCVPMIERIDNDSTSIGQTIVIAVTFAMSGPFLKSEELLPGACWHPMFRNPVMVVGYPIRSRLETDLGLEMPLNMMAELSGTSRADLVDGKAFLKGFSTMLIATKQAHDIIIWHYFYHAEKERLSYFDHALENIDNINLSSLNSRRHIIGWCEDCKLFTGDPVLAGKVPAKSAASSTYRLPT